MPRFDWFRWYHTTSEDPKWREVLRWIKERAPIGRGKPVNIRDLIAVWAVMLEQASQQEPLRNGELKRQNDHVAAVLDLELDTVDIIWMAFEAVGMIGTDPFRTFITNWNKRQFVSDKDPTNATRQARHREKKKAAERHKKNNGAVTDSNAPESDTDSESEEKKETPYVPLEGETDENVTGNRAPRSRASPRFPITDDFEPSEESYVYGVKLGLTRLEVMKAVPEFIRYWKGEGKLKADWQATFQNRLEQIAERKKNNPPTGDPAKRPPPNLF